MRLVRTFFQNSFHGLFILFFDFLLKRQGRKILKVNIRKQIFDAPTKGSSSFYKNEKAYFGYGKYVQEGEWKGKFFPIAKLLCVQTSRLGKGTVGTSHGNIRSR